MSRSDDFNRSDGAIGSPSDGGAAWEVLAGSPVIVSNKAKTAGADIKAVLQDASADVAVSMVVTGFAGAYNVQVMGRVSDASNFISLCLFEDGNIYLFKIEGGSAESLDDAAYAPSSGVVPTLEMNGPALVGKVNGVTIVSGTSSFNQSATKHGFLISGTGESVDDFSSTDISAPSGLAAVAASTTQINLTWTDNTDNETGFSIDYEQVDSGATFTSPTTTTAAADAESKSITGLTEGKRYIFRVKASRAGGDTQYSSTIAAYTLPAAPTSLSVTSADADGFSLSWTDNSATNTHYEIEIYSDSGLSTLVDTLTIADGTTTDTSGLDDGTYWVRMRAKIGSVYSAYSNTATATVGASISPAILVGAFGFGFA